MVRLELVVEQVANPGLDERDLLLELLQNVLLAQVLVVHGALCS